MNDALAVLLGLGLGIAVIVIAAMLTRRGQWIGHSGQTIDDAQREQLEQDLARIRAKYGMDK